MKNIELGKIIIRKLAQNGYKAYFVGGFVRDILLNREINDIDIATDANPEIVMSIFSKTIPTGIKHGTVTVLVNGIPHEVTTFRSEGKYLDYRHPNEIKFVSNLDEDLGRRDFTMNAIAMSENEEIVDPFKGREALNQRIIVSVGNTKERFLEDPLRMMRAIRFASQLNFKIEHETWNGLVENAPYLQYIASERIKIEFDKIMESNSPEIGINLLFESKLINWIKDVDDTNITNLNYRYVTNLIKKTKDPLIRWFLLLNPLESDERQTFMNHLRFSNKEKNTLNGLFQSVFILQNEISTENIKKSLIETDYLITIKSLESIYLLGYINNFEKKEWIKKFEYINKNLKVREIKDLSLSGMDLIIFFNKLGGPWVNELLVKLLDRVIYKNLVNEIIVLLNEAKKINEEKGNEGKN